MSSSLSEIIPWGRSLDEYRRMFALDESDLARPILGCGDGPASFNAELSALGRRVISVDPLYAFSSDEIAARIAKVAPRITEQSRREAAHFLWDEFGSPDALREHRLATMRRFLEDYPAGRAAGRYVAAALPRLPWPDQTFDLALSSHLLFTYGHLLDGPAHVAAMLEMGRVARRVRIFPLVGHFGDGRSPHLDLVIEAARARGWSAEIRQVVYEFQRGGNQMLEICTR